MDYRDHGESDEGGEEGSPQQIILIFLVLFSLFLLDEQHNITQNYVEETVKKGSFNFLFPLWMNYLFIAVGSAENFEISS